MTKQPNEIRSISDLVQILKDLGEPEPGKTRFFRGQAGEWALLPGIYRKPYLIENEDKIIKDALTNCPDDFSPNDTLFEKLVKLQHYGYATRLLDLTTNALVALYFACSNENHHKKNGELIILDIPDTEMKYGDSDTVAILAAISIQKKEFSPKEDTSISSFNEDPDIISLLHDIRTDKPSFRPVINPKDLTRVLCVRAKLNNARISRQQGCFLLFGINNEKLNPAKIPDDWERLSTEGKRFIVTNKKQIMQELKAFGISRQTLFPELESQAKEIMAQYEK